MTFSNLRTSICDHFNIDVPIFVFTHSVEVVVAVTKAGGFAVYGATRRFPEEITRELADIRSQIGDRPYGVDLVMPKNIPEDNDRAVIEKIIPDGHRQFVKAIADKYQVPAHTGPGMRTRFVRCKAIIDAQVAAVASSDVNLVALGIGSPAEVISCMKAAGKCCVSLVGQQKHARKAIAAGADILVAQGSDAGGHTGTIGTFSLVPQIVAVAEGRPVLAAGGVATGQHIAAALALGAVGVWLGTAFLLTEENASHMSRGQIEKLIEAQAIDTVVTRAESGKPFRQNRSAWSDEWGAEGAPEPLGHPAHDILVGDLLGAIKEHSVKPLSHMGCGQGINWFNRVRSTADVMCCLCEEAENTLASLSRRYRGKEQ